MNLTGQCKIADNQRYTQTGVVGGRYCGIQTGGDLSAAKSAAENLVVIVILPSHRAFNDFCVCWF